MNEEWRKQYMQEMRAYLKEKASNDTLNDIKCFTSKETLNVTSNDIKFIEKSKYIKMLQTLESWNVFKPKSLCFQYGVERCYTIYEYVLNTPDVKNKGAYYRKMLKIAA